MKTRLIIASMMLMAATPAFAQMGTSSNGGNGGSGGMGTPDNAMTPSTMTCQQMMDSTQPKVMAMSDGDQKSMMMHQMKMANDAMTMHHEKSCKMHMQKVMGMM
jgi:hypothetical protein